MRFYSIANEVVGELVYFLNPVAGGVIHAEANVTELIKFVRTFSGETDERCFLVAGGA